MWELLVELAAFKSLKVKDVTVRSGREHDADLLFGVSVKDCGEGRGFLVGFPEATIAEVSAERGVFSALLAPFLHILGAEKHNSCMLLLDVWTGVGLG